MKDIKTIAVMSHIPEDFLKGSLGITTLEEEAKNPRSYYHRLTPVEKKIMDMPDLDEANATNEVRYFYFEFLSRNPEPEFQIATLTKWIMVASTFEQLLEPFKIAFESQFYDVAQAAARKIYALA